MTSFASAPPRADQRECVSLDEARKRLERLTAHELARLTLHARALTLRSRMETEELVNEAVVAVATGRRPWPNELAPVPFLCGVMSSLVSCDQKKAAKLVLVPVGGDDDGQGDILASMAASDPDPEDALLRAEQEKAVEDAIYESLEEDLTAQMVMMARLEGKSPAEICEELDMSRVEYDSTNRRIRRKMIGWAQKGTVK